MLSNMRIGMKLLVGFGLLVLLLVAIGATGFFSLLSINTSTDGVLNQVEVFAKSNEAVIASFEAQLASAEHSRTQDPAYHDKVVEQVSKITTACDEAEKIMESKENKDNANSIAQKAKEFQDLDSSFKDVVVDLKKALEIRSGAGEAVLKASTALQDRIWNVAQEANYVQEGQGTDRQGNVKDDYKFYREDRVQALLLNAKVQQLFLDCRVESRNYDTEIDPEKRKASIDKISNYLKEIRGICDDVMKNYTVSDTCDNFVKTVQTGLNEWETQFNNSVKEMATLEANQSQQDAKATEVDNTIGAVVDGVTKHVREVGSDMAGLISWVQMIILIVAGVAVVVGIFAGVLVARNITTGIGSATSIMGRIANDGDLTMEISATNLKRRDEVGELARAVQEIIGEFRNVEQLAQDLAGGNWQANVKVRGDLDAMNINLNKMLDQVNDALQRTAEAVDQVATGATQVAAASESLSQGATQSAASIEEITASMSEIGGQTNANAQNANEANKLAQGANESAAKGQDMMKRMISSMDTITKNSTDIQKVVKVIDDISFQTNLLALNAAVEAARAGAHGKGFAVVAEEVRNLASRSAKAAAETTQMINTNSRQINEGAEIAHQTSEMLDGIVGQSTQVASILKEIANASNEQAQGVSQVSQGLHQIDAVTQQNTANAEETASVSHEMSSQASTLQNLIGQFQLRKASAAKYDSASKSSDPVVKIELGDAAKPAAPAAPKPGDTDCDSERGCHICRAKTDCDTETRCIESDTDCTPKTGGEIRPQRKRGR